MHTDLDARHHMVETQLRQRGISNDRVLAAMSRVPRHEFVDQRYAAQAYDDHPLPIGEGQTISQPYIVALMLELLDPAPDHVILEIGTGSGYQTALLAELARHVYAIERHPALAATAQGTLQRLGYSNITLEIGDGSAGLAAHAPYDGIIVAAAAPALPQMLFDQLKEGGRLVIPIGPSDAQDLQLVTKLDGKPVVTGQTGCRFVPLVGEHGYKD
ncbi:MAG TPA: protein-L-isoaspartate(D-aspartate) O-methyltransferase [Terriglobales bacterium]|nr:protein-L-isoaspartate(D-aspartate) O-methyltransferase [Terriglobales bacterium]